MKIVNNVWNKYWSYRDIKISIIHTLLINLRCFSLRTALKFPIYVYPNTEIHSKGTIDLHGDIRAGMIKIGNRSAKASGKTKIFGKGTYIIHGEVQFWGGCVVENWGIVELGKKVVFAENCRILCRNKNY